jgi:hypothetical protein
LMKLTDVYFWQLCSEDSVTTWDERMTQRRRSLLHVS